MSYCRFSEGDVYLYHDGSRYCCCSCGLNKLLPSGFHESTYLDTPQDTYEHMLKHKTAGHDFPESVLEELKEEMDNA